MPRCGFGGDNVTASRKEGSGQRGEGKAGQGAKSWGAGKHRRAPSFTGAAPSSRTPRLHTGVGPTVRYKRFQCPSRRTRKLSVAAVQDGSPGRRLWCQNFPIQLRTRRRDLPAPARGAAGRRVITPASARAAARRLSAPRVCCHAAGTANCAVPLLPPLHGAPLGGAQPASLEPESVTLDAELTELQERISETDMSLL